MRELIIYIDGYGRFTIEEFGYSDVILYYPIDSQLKEFADQHSRWSEQRLRWEHDVFREDELINTLIQMGREDVVKAYQKALKKKGETYEWEPFGN